MLPALAHVDTWIFDLDNTLYPASCELFGLIDARMTAYVARLTGTAPDEARAIQKRYFHEHGTTLSGADDPPRYRPARIPRDVHAIEMDVLREDRRLIDALARLPGRKLVFTNGDEPYARRVLERLGLSGQFRGDPRYPCLRYRPKPHADAYVSMLAALAVDPARALFAEDMGAQSEAGQGARHGDPVGR